jgi:outer membrane receptor for ferrienterochelin and colicins
LFGAFRSWWKNLVELHPLSYAEAQHAAEQGRLPVALPNVGYTQYENASSIDSYGANVSFEGAFVEDRLRYAIHVTEAFSRRNDPVLGSQPLAVAPRFYGNARLSYDLGGPLPTAALSAYTLSLRSADRAIESGFSPPPTAPTQVDLRATLSGSVPLLKGLSYRVSADVLVGEHGPYVIGPLLVSTPEHPTAELTPLPAFRASVGLSYDFWGE